MSDNVKRIECHLFSGLFAVGERRGTKALEKLIDDLPGEVDAHHHREGRWKWVLQGILARSASLGPAKVILIGHSKGAKRCQQIASAMDGAGLPVSYIAGIDPTALFSMQKPMIISKNVTSVDEFYAERGVCHRARKKDPSGNGGGKFIIPGALAIKHNIFKVPTDHIRCPASKITRDRVVKRVTKIFNSVTQ